MNEIIPNLLAIGFMCMGFVEIDDFLAFFALQSTPGYFYDWGKAIQMTENFSRDPWDMI
jgi:hypothetical protein